MLPEVQQPAIPQENASSYIPQVNHHQPEQPVQHQPFNSNYPFHSSYGNHFAPGQYVPMHGMYQMPDVVPPPPYYNHVPFPQPPQSPEIVQESNLNVVESPENPSPATPETGKRTNNLASILKSKICAICGDRPTGKHYGAYACDGCKGFFRRNIRSNVRNECRFSKECVVSKENRNHCRACRMQKCFDVGMRRESVQNERDPITPKAGQKQMVMLQDGKMHSFVSFMAALVNAEMSSRADQPKLADCGVNIESNQVANLKNISISLEKHVPALAKWAGLNPVMAHLSRNDQFTLFQAHLPEKWILDLVIRSLPLNDVLLLTNDLIIPKNCDASTEPPEITRIYTRIFNELVSTMKELSMDHNEIACLKAIAFFNLSVSGLDSQAKVKELRSQVQVCLEDYVHKQYTKGRFGEILLILPTLQSIITELIVQMRVQPILVLANQPQPEMVDANSENHSVVEENINKTS